MSQRMKALESFRLRGQRIQPGDIFKAKGHDVAQLTLVKYAEVIPDGAIETVQKAQAEKGKPKTSADFLNVPHNKLTTTPKEKNLTEMTVAELREHGKALGLDMDSKLRKSELLDVVRRGRYQRRDMRAV